MALQCGIVGLPNVGKSTLFNCLSNAKAQSANFPFCTIEPNVGVITVPDERLNKLAEIEHPQRVIPTTVEIVDIAGLVKGASKGEGLGNKFLANIRETSCMYCVASMTTILFMWTAVSIRFATRKSLTPNCRSKTWKPLTAVLPKCRNRLRQAVTSRLKSLTKYFANIRKHWNRVKVPAPFLSIRKTNRRSHTIYAC